MIIFNPRQTVLISCHGKLKTLGKEVEKHDIFPLNWHSPASWNPGMYAIFVSKLMPAVEIIRNSKSFVVNFIPYTLKQAVIKAGKHHGEHVEKAELIGLHHAPCEKLVDNFRIKEAIAWLECEVVEEKEVGDHILFLARVVWSHLEKPERRLFHIDADKFTTTKD